MDIMSDGPAKARRFQVSLKTLFAIIAVIGIGMALLKTGRPVVAMGVVLPFAVGLTIGEMVPFPHSAWLSAIVSPFVVCIFLVPFVTLVDDRGISDILQTIILGFWLGVMLLLAVIPSVAAITGCLVSHCFRGTWSRGKTVVPEHPISD